MATQSASGAGRRPRADARRNRERIVEAAREVFTEHGAEARMEDIGRRAGVGAGTLYRHFATREALIEEVYRTSVEKLVAAGERYAATMEPEAALRRWMLLFVDHVAKKWLILPAMETVPGGASRLLEGSRGDIHGMFRGLVERAIASGALDRKTRPEDIVRGLIGVFHTTGMPGWEASAKRLVDVLIAGSRAR